MIQAVKTIVSGSEFDALPYEEGRNWELLAGELIALPSPTAIHQLIAGDLYAAFRQYFRGGPVGGAILDVEFALHANTRLRPDLAILLEENWQQLDRAKTPILGAPDIAIEIISPSEHSGESFRKVRTYLRHGVREVWQVYPSEASVLIHTEHSALVVAGMEGKLTSALLPGWELSVASILNG